MLGAQAAVKRPTSAAVTFLVCLLVVPAVVSVECIDFGRA